MQSRETYVAERHFPGPPPGSRHFAPISARPALTPGNRSRAYHVMPMSQAQWKQIWIQIMSRGQIWIAAPRPEGAPPTVLLVFETPCRAFRLAMTACVVSDCAGRFVASVEPPALSWRLAAVRFGRRLPEEPTFHNGVWPIDPALVCSDPRPEDYANRLLRLRPDLPGPAASLATTPELTPIVTALRAGFHCFDSLLAEVAIAPDILCEYLATLEHVGLLVDAPTALIPTDDPFDYFGLHWSAHETLIRKRHEALVGKIEADPCGLLDPSRLEQAHALLSSYERRCALRRARLSPPVIGEVADHLRRLLRRALDRQRERRAIDLGRRILELAPYDTETRGILSKFLPHIAWKKGPWRLANL